MDYVDATPGANLIHAMLRGRVPWRHRVGALERGVARANSEARRQQCVQAGGL